MKVRPGREPDERFDALTSEAKAAVDGAATTLRAVHDRYRSAYHEAFGRWQGLREEIDTFERALRSGNTEAVDRAALHSLAEAYDHLTAELGRRRTELAKLELAQRGVEGALTLVDPRHENLDGPPEVVPVDVQLRVVQAHEDERARLAQEIHDGPAQVLSNAIFQVDYIERIVDKEPSAAHDELRLLRDLLRRELGEVRSYITQLRPPRLLQLGLYGAIAESAESFGAMTGLSVATDLGAPAEELDEAAQTVVLRIVQEALQNARKHAGATRVAVVTSSDGANWHLEIRDDGRGFDPDEVAARRKRSFGLQFMRERAQLISADLEVRSRPDGGTIVTLSIPIRKE